jgi:hypothetical protein
MNLGDYIEVYGDIENTLKADGYDDCIVGVDTKSRLIYNADKIVDRLTEEMTREEALEFFYYNIEGAYVGEYTPIYAFGMGELDIKIKECLHENIEYQPEEKENNVAAGMCCADCGEELPSVSS